MTTGQKSSKFYVVGGPVQPDRACYVVRDADATLYARLSDGDYCHVLSPPHTGKSSLMAHAAARLRTDGVAVATVDLTQISHRDPAEDAGRWYYSVAYRIVRELRIKADMQSWWRERSGLTNMQRLRDFFLDLVLAETDRRVVVFVDGVEAALGLEVARELLGAIRACYDSRAMEPEYERLSFALLGAATVGQLVPAGEDSPFDVSTAITLPDFDKEEIRRLTSGLACDPSNARLIAERVYEWTRGHPYLSQKILRALSRRRVDELEAPDVDAVVNTLFFGRNATREETHLSAVAGELLSESPGKAARLTLYGRVRKAGAVPSDPVSEPQRDLLRSGVVVENAAAELVVRNPVYAESLTPRWVNQHLPFGLRGVAVAATIVLLIVAIPVWYTEYLPQPYIRQLTTPNQDYVTALDAYERLSFLPGFGAMAEQLFSDFLARQSRRATRLPEVRRFTEQLAEIPNRQLLAAELLAEYWDRQTSVFMHRGDRDPALLFARRALDIPTDERRSQVTELFGDDFRSLRATLRTRDPLRALEIDAESGLITTLDERHVASVWQLDADGLRQIQSFPLLAEEIVPLQRRLVFDGAADGRRLRLTVETDHPRPSDIVIELRAPSGRQVRIPLTSGTLSDAPGVFRFDSRRNRELRSLLEESVNGTWTAYFTDQVQGVGGVLLDWSLQVQDAAATAPPGTGQDPAPIPEPGVARQASSELALGGGLALTWPADPAVRGDILIWKITGGEVAARIPRPPGFVDAQFALGDSAVLITAARTVELWHAGRAELLLSIPIEPSLAPVLSANGRYLVVDSILGEADNALAVWDLAERREIGRLITGALAELVTTDSSGRYLAVGDGDRLVRIWSIRNGQLLAELEHGAPPISIDFDDSGSWLVTQDAAHALRVWKPADNAEPIITRQASSFWNTAFSAGFLLLGSLDHGYEVVQLPEAIPLGPVLHHGVPPDREAPAGFAGWARFAAGQGIALTYDGSHAVRFWQVSAAVDAEPVGDGRPTQIHAAALDRTGRQVALATGAGDVRVLPMGEQPLLLPDAPGEPAFIGHLAPVTVVRFDGTGDAVASGSLDGSVRIWDAATGAPRPFFSSHVDGAVHDLAFSPDGHQLASASRGIVMVIDTQSGELLAQTAIQSSQPQLAVGPQGSVIYIAGDRSGLTRWVWRGGVIENVLTLDARVTRVALSPDGRFLVVADGARQIRLIDAGFRESLGSTRRLPAAVERLWFSAKGDRVIAQAGLWIHSFSTAAGELDYLATRRLARSPVALQPVGDQASVLTITGVSRPFLGKVNLLSPLNEDIQQLSPPSMPDLEAMISLTLTDWGEPQALN